MFTNEWIYCMCRIRLRLLCFLLFCGSILSGCAASKNAGITSIDVNSTTPSVVSPKPQSSSYIDLGWMPVVNNDPRELSGFKIIQRAMRMEEYIQYVIHKLGLPDYINESNDNKLHLAYLGKGVIYQYIFFSGVFPKEIHYTEFQNSLPLSLYQQFRENDVKLVAHAQKPLPQAAVEVTSVEKKESSEITDVSYKQQISPSTLKASTERRVALVIGNAGYKYTSPLRNPLNDARDMVKVLHDLNFDTIEVSNGSKRQMIDAIETFGERLQHAQVGLFYFSGHGVQYHGRNYLIPVEAKITHATDLEHDSVDVTRVLGRMDHASTALNIVILDACRNNPYRNLIGFRSDGDRGLAQISGVRSSLIAYATQPDNVAEDGTGLNGTYTKHLLEYLKRPGLSLPDLFSQVGRSVSQETNGKQQPWVSFSSLPHFCFSGCDPVW